LNSKKNLLSDKLLLFKLLPLSWEVMPGKLHPVFSSQVFDAAATVIQFKIIPKLYPCLTGTDEA